MLSVFRFFSITYLTKGNLTVSIKFRRLKKLEKYHEKTTTYWGTSGCCWTCWFLVAGGCGLSFAGSLEAGVAAFVGFEACCWLGLDFDGKSPILTSFRRRCNLHTVITLLAETIQRGPRSWWNVNPCLSVATQVSQNLLFPKSQNKRLANSKTILTSVQRWDSIYNENYFLRKVSLSLTTLMTKARIYRCGHIVA